MALGTKRSASLFLQQNICRPQTVQTRLSYRQNRGMTDRLFQRCPIFRTSFQNFPRMNAYRIITPFHRFKPCRLYIENAFSRYSSIAMRMNIQQHKDNRFYGTGS